VVHGCSGCRVCSACGYACLVHKALAIGLWVHVVSGLVSLPRALSLCRFLSSALCIISNVCTNYVHTYQCVCVLQKEVREETGAYQVFLRPPALYE